MIFFSYTICISKPSCKWNDLAGSNVHEQFYILSFLKICLYHKRILFLFMLFRFFLPVHFSPLYLKICPYEAALPCLLEFPKDISSSARGPKYIIPGRP
jgi:hypothetical protein